MINKVKTYSPKFTGARILNQIPVHQRVVFAPVKSNFKENVRNIFGELFPKLDPDYDEFVLKNQNVEPPKSYINWEVVSKILTAKI